MFLRPNFASRPLIGHLITFIAVAETRSFRRAAELVGRSQPAVTAQVSQLETLLGVSLFTRTTRQVQLTTAGTELLERAKKLVVETDKLIRDFQGQANLMSGRVAVSVAPTVACSSTFSRSLVLFEQDYPNITVSIREDLQAEMFEALQTGDVEMGIGPYKDVPERLLFEPLLEQPFFLILSADHVIAKRGHVAFRELEGLALLCPARGTTARALIEDTARKTGITLHVKYEALQHQTLISMVSAGLGATVAPLTDRRVLAALELVALPFEDARPVRQVGVISRRNEQLAPPATAFVQHLLVMSTAATGDQTPGGHGLRVHSED